MSVVVTQGTRKSSPATIAVGDIPQLSDYGTSLGTISRTFYNFQIMMLGQEQGQLQAIQATNGNSVNTSSASSDVQNLLLGTIRARNDVDRVITSNSLAIPVGTLSGNLGQANFDRNSLELEDRVIGWYLTNLASITGNGGSLSIGYHRSFGKVRYRHAAGAGQRHTLGINFGKTLSSIGNIADAVKSGFDIQAALNKGGPPLDQALAVAGGLVGGMEAIGLGGPVVVGGLTVAATVGLAVAEVVVINTGYEVGCNIYAAMSQASPGGNGGAVQAGVAQISDLASTGIEAAMSATLTLAMAPPGTGTVASLIYQAMNRSSSSGPQYIEADGLVKEDTTFVTSGVFQADQQTSVAEALQIDSTFSLQSPDLYQQVLGIADISQSAGPLLGELPEVSLTTASSSPTLTSGIADESGNYQVWVPLGTIGVNYSGVNLQAFDPNTGSGTILASETVDLTPLQYGPETLATISGSCNDTDADNPDGDDPDCD